MSSQNLQKHRRLKLTYEIIDISRQEVRHKLPINIDFLTYREIVGKIWNSAFSGISSVTIDFGCCTSVFSGPMLAICCAIIALRESPQYKTEFKLILPEKNELQQLFKNTNWAHLIQPSVYSKSQYRDKRNIPALRFQNPQDQKLVVGKVIDSFMQSMEGFSVNDLSSIDWAISEIIDNVLIHSLSPVGGIIQVMNSRHKNTIEFNICDPGVGIQETLKGTSKSIKTEEDALLHCVRKGVTRDPSIGKGYGLYGSSRIAINTGGYFAIHSGYSYLLYPKNYVTNRRDIDHPRVYHHRHTYPGTLVMASIDISSHDSLFSALSIGGDEYVLPNTLEHRYESPEKIKEYDDVVILVRTHVDSFGSRLAARPLNIMIQNLLRMLSRQSVILDFDGIDMISHSFADEAIGKLYASISLRNRLRLLKWKNINPICEKILFMVIAQNSG